jgi:hypothetical protein
MKTSVSAKRCPQCGKVTGLHASECGACGHQFRTRFEEPVERTEAFDAVMLPRPPAPHPPPPRRQGVSPFVLAFLGSFCLVSVAGLAAWLAWSLSLGIGPRSKPFSAPTGSSPRAPLASFDAGARPRGGAENLYERIEISMSLYDVDQAAGGMGRLARSSDPHLLLLSYDYPDQNVRVSLFRGDLSGDDYRVQAVALYHGNVLLHRHTDDN